MRQLSDKLEFEGGKIRDRLGAWKGLESQHIIAELGDVDVIGLYRETRSVIFMLFIRNGMVIGRKDFFLKKVSDIEDEELIASFIGSFIQRDAPLRE
jgi:excinuclease ABC subunit C